MVLVSYIELFTTDFAVEYVVPYIGTAFPLLVRSARRLTCTTLRVGSQLA